MREREISEFGCWLDTFDEKSEKLLSYNKFSILGLGLFQNGFFVIYPPLMRLFILFFSALKIKKIQTTEDSSERLSTSENE